MKNFSDEKSYNIIVAADVNGNIGYKNTIPWKLKGDLARFKHITMGSILIMGKNTYQSIKNPLEGRIKIVVSKTLDKSTIKDGDTYVFNSLAKAMGFINTSLPKYKNVFFIGGVSLYNFALALGATLYWTEVHSAAASNVTYDTTIPNFKDKIEKNYSEHTPDKLSVTDENGVLTHTYRTFCHKSMHNFKNDELKPFMLTGKKTYSLVV